MEKSADFISFHYDQCYSMVTWGPTTVVGRPLISPPHILKPSYYPCGSPLGVAHDNRCVQAVYLMQIMETLAGSETCKYM